MKLQPEHVKGARAMLRLSAEDLAAECGVTSSTILNFEQSRHEPREDTLLRIQTALENRGILFSNGDMPTVTLDRRKARQQRDA